MKLIFAAVDPAAIVDHAVIGRDRVTGRAKRLCGAAIGDGLADLDLGIGNA
jgi:hypothetical protein